MYGTIAKAKVADGKFDELVALMDEWDRDFRPKVEGAMGSVAYRLDSDPNTIYLAAVFASKDAYQANAESPEQDGWYKRFRACLVSDPEWLDGEVFRSSLG
jgi:quinol monooxygenase YgiN